MASDTHADKSSHSTGSMAGLVRELVRPYQGWLIVIL